MVGNVPERRRLESLAGPSVRFTGHLPRAELIELFSRCHAYVVPGEEDFGIAAVEPMACGKPVIALERGGVTETVVDGVTGVLFGSPSSASLAEAMERLESLALDAASIRDYALKFDRPVFFEAWRNLLASHGVPHELYSRTVA